MTEKNDEGTANEDPLKKKKFSLDMNTVFFGIVAVAFLFMAVGTFFPAHQKYVNKPVQMKVIKPHRLSGNLTFTDFECKESDRVTVKYITDDTVASIGQAVYQDAWTYTLPVVSLDEGSVFAHCENANGKEALVQMAVSEDIGDLTLTPVPLLPDKVGQAALASAKASVNLAIGLIGYIALFLGLMKIVEKAGGLLWMAGLIRPLLVRLFPDVPPDHPAMGAMVMNIAANALGLGNAATPFGLKAMKELNDINPHKGTATNAMCLFFGDQYQWISSSSNRYHWFASTIWFSGSCCHFSNDPYCNRVVYPRGCPCRQRSCKTFCLSRTRCGFCAPCAYTKQRWTC